MKSIQDANKKCEYSIAYIIDVRMNARRDIWISANDERDEATCKE